MLGKKDIWEQIVSGLKTSMPQSEINTWFSQTECSKFDSNNAVIDVPNKFIATWLKDNYLQKINGEISKITNDRPHISFRYKNKSKKIKTVKKKYNKYFTNDNLNKSMTFNSFSLGDCNKFAYSSAVEITKNPGENYNPLYIFSKNGIGKTHLLNAIGNRIQENDKNLNIGLINTKSFVSAFGHSIKKKSYDKFKDTYNNLDILLMDDIQYLANSNRIQDEFMSIFNKLYGENRQIVLTADRPPNNLKKINNSLKSRLGWGLLAEINELDYKTKLNIINDKIKSNNNKIPSDIINFLVKSNNDIKIILKNIIRIETYLSLNKGKINLSIVKTLIKDRYNKDIDIKEIQSVIAGYFSISVSDLISNNKKTIYSYPRHIAMYICRNLTDLSFKEIGYHFGDRDHSTIIYAINKIGKKIKDNIKIKTDIDNVVNILT